jgi:hypothetical protein
VEKLVVVLGILFICSGGRPIDAQQATQPATQEPSQKKSGLFCTRGCGSTDHKSYDVSNKTYTGETIRGPRIVVAYNLNPLRYSYKWQAQTSYSAAPDLWSKLTSIASPQSAGAQPAAPKAKAPTGSGSQPGTAMRAAAQKPLASKALATKGQPPISQASIDLAKKAQSAIDAAESAIDNVNAQIKGIDGSLKTSITSDFTEAMSFVAVANTATNSVSTAGSELVRFIKSSDYSSVALGIQGELASGSIFMTGVDAGWPDPSAVSNLATSVTSRQDVLTAIQKILAANQTGLLTGLIASQKDLESVGDSLKQQAIVVGAGPKNDQEAQLIATSIADVESRTAEVNAAISDLQAAADLLTWALSESKAMLSALSDLSISGDKYKAFQTAHATLVQWQQTMTQLGSQIQAISKATDSANRFVTTFTGACDYTFATTKKIAIKLTETDNLPDKSAAQPADVLSLTMECASPFNVSAGVMFDTISGNQFSIAPVASPPGSTTTVNEFVQTSSSSFHPSPVGLISARFCEPNETIAFHISLGVSGNFNSQANGGSSAAFLIGPSVSFFRTMFITPGWYIGTRAALGSSFHAGDPVPPNVTAAPVNSSYTSGFGLAITFTKP